MGVIGTAVTAGEAAEADVVCEVEEGPSAALLLPVCCTLMKGTDQYHTEEITAQVLRP